MIKPHCEFVIQPNSAHHRSSWFLPFTILALICLGVSLRFAFLGYWLILPFALIDIMVVGFVFWLMVKRSNYVEKISMRSDELHIQHIERKNPKSWCFPLHWAQIELRSPTHDWYPNSLLLGSKGQWVEVGQCLTNEERQSLASEMRRELNRLKQPDFLNHA